MKIAICCSMKYRDIAIKVFKDIEDAGATPLFPNLIENSTEIDKDDMNYKKKLALEHYKAIDESDMVYFITKDGYMGTSVKLELGYSIAKGKKIIFSEPTKDTSLDHYTKDFVPTENVALLIDSQK